MLDFGGICCLLPCSAARSALPDPRDPTPELDLPIPAAMLGDAAAAPASAGAVAAEEAEDPFLCEADRLEVELFRGFLQERNELLRQAQLAAAAQMEEEQEVGEGLALSAQGRTLAAADPFCCLLLSALANASRRCAHLAGVRAPAAPRRRGRRRISRLRPALAARGGRGHGRLCQEWVLRVRNGGGLALVLDRMPCRAGDKRIPRRGEVGLSAQQIERYENIGYVMSGSRHARMNAIRMRKENQVYTAEEKAALAMLNFEEKKAKEDKVLADLKKLVDRSLGHVK